MVCEHHFEDSYVGNDWGGDGGYEEEDGGYEEEENAHPGGGRLAVVLQLYSPLVLDIPVEGTSSLHDAQNSEKNLRWRMKLRYFAQMTGKA